MGLDWQRVTQLWNPYAKKVGSGYLVTDRHVLTAHHVVAEAAGPCQARGIDAEWIEAEVVWQRDDLDLALLELVGAWTLPIQRASGWARVDREEPELNWTAVGFPAVQKEENRSDTYQARGAINPLNALRSGRLECDVKTPLPNDSKRWAGISGAGVFAGLETPEFLVAVVLEVPLGFGGDRFIAAPVSAATVDEKFSAILRSAGADLPISLPRVSRKKGPRQLPRDLADFTDRDRYLRDLRAYLAETDVGQPMALTICTITGKPGVGKSALAVHAANQVSERFPDAQLYARLDGQQATSQEPLAVLEEFIRALDPTARAIPADVEARAARYRELLAGQQALVLLDDAHDAPQVRLLLPGGPPCAVLITSRSRLATLEGARLVELPQMDTHDAVELLRRVVGEERIATEEAAAAQIAQLCGGLPLALRIAAAILKDRPEWKVGRLAKRLEDNRKRLSEMHMEDLDVRASFEVSYGNLAPRAKRTFRLLGLLPGADFSPSLVAAVLEAELSQVNTDLDQLRDAHLLEEAGGRYSFHDLLRLFAQEHLEAEEPEEVRKAALERALAWYLDNARQHDKSVLSQDQGDRR